VSYSLAREKTVVYLVALGRISMFSLSGLDWALVIASALFIGLAKTAISGLGLLTVIMMAMVFPAKESTGIVLPMLVFGDVFAVVFYRRHGNLKVVLRLLPFAVAGVVAGFLFMDRIDDVKLRRIIGWVVLIMITGNVLLKLRSGESKVLGFHFAAPWVQGTLGVFAGFTTMIANAAGPVMTVYLEAMGVKKEEFVGTMAWFFAVVNLVKVPFSVKLGLVTGESLRFGLPLLPVITAGAVGGYFALRAVPQKAFDISVLALAAASAMHLVAV
jgi:uncharacterized membrane protein YfcA